MDSPTRIDLDTRSVPSNKLYFENVKSCLIVAIYTKNTVIKVEEASNIQIIDLFYLTDYLLHQKSAFERKQICPFLSNKA